MIGRCIAAALLFLAWPSNARADDAPATPEQEPRESAPTRDPEPAPPAWAPATPLPLPAPRLVVPARFGEPGVVVVSADSSLSLSFTTHAPPSEAQRTAIDIGPGADVFVVRNLSIGGSIDIGVSDAKYYTPDDYLVQTVTTDVTGAARLGYALRLGPVVSIWPRLSVGARWVHTKPRALTPPPSLVGRVVAPPRFVATDADRTGPYVALFVPVLLHPAPSFFVGMGPHLYHGPDERIVDEGVRTTVSARMVVGGNFGGTSTEADEDPALLTPGAPENTTRIGFGERRDLLFTGDLSVGAYYSSLSRGGDGASLTFSPAVDYFVGEHFSVGGGVHATWSQSEAALAEGSRARSEVRSFGANMRLGVEISLAKRLSLYPRAFLGLTYGKSRTETVGLTKTFDTTAIQGTLDVPLVVHVMRHFFVGWGPYVRRDLVRWYDGDATKARETALGAALLVGGWL